MLVQNIAKGVFCMCVVVHSLFRMFSGRYGKAYSLATIIIAISTVTIESVMSYILICNLINYASMFVEKQPKVRKVKRRRVETTNFNKGYEMRSM